MEKDYAGYNKLNWLLTDCLEAERRYFNASEDIQEAELKRFLNHESVNRNLYSSKIKEAILQAGLQPLKYDTPKGNLHRNGLDIKNVLESNKWRQYLESCIKQDERCLKKYSEVLIHSDLPEEVLIMLQKQRSSILEALDQAILYKRRPEVPIPKLDPKVRKLKAM